MIDRGGTRRVRPADDEFQLVETLYASEAARLGRVPSPGSSHQDRSDLVHDAFVRLLALGPERLRQLAAEQPVGYLRRIARHIGLDHAKRDRRRSAALHVPLEDADAHGIDLERQIEARDTLRQVEQAVAAMPPRTRSIFIARRVHGMSYAEIAGAGGMSIKAVEKQMGRALQILSREMDRLGHD
ncbi:RNA polymerase sigma factor [Sphingomonas sp. CJ99]